MSFVRLLTGDIAPESMGFIYLHEYIVCCPAYWVERGQEDLFLNDPVKSEEEVRLAKLAGADIIVDVTAIDHGRDPETVHQISLYTGTQTIGAAGSNKGLLWDTKTPGEEWTYRERIDKSSVEELTRFAIDEVEVRMQDTGVRGGQARFGTGHNSISPLEIKTIWTGRRTHLETGALIHSHTEAGTMTLEQMKYTREREVGLSHVSFGHMDRNSDTYHHLKIADTGAFLRFDGIAKVKHNSESVRIGHIPGLAKRGYQKQILVSRDMARRGYYRGYMYVLGLPYIKEVWVERLVKEAKMAGLDGRALVQDTFVNNPRRCFIPKK